MKLTTTIEESLSLMRIEVRHGDDSADVRAQYQALLISVARSRMRRLLLDYSHMPVDITIDDFLEIRTRYRHLFNSIRKVKTAVVLREELATTMILMAAMRTFGVRVVSFTDRHEALTWLLYDDGMSAH